MSMDVVLGSLLGADLVLEKAELQYCSGFLNQVLQSDTKSYEAYFSSRPVNGSVVEHIAEIDAEISLVERKLRSLLVENKVDVVREVVNNEGAVEGKMTVIRQELEQLWELDNGTDQRKDIDDFLETNDQVEEKQEDQFQNALKRLKSRILRNEQDGSTGGLAIVLENLDKTTDLMELPFLARTCIRTGHYQEAVMLYTYSKSLLVKFPGSSIIEGIHRNVAEETTTTMLTGLLRLLSTNLTANSLKKVLNYLASIPPFDDRDKSSLLQVYSYMRYNFIQQECSSYSFEVDQSNDALLEMIIKKRIEVLREHTHMSLSVFMEQHQFTTIPVAIPLDKRLSKVPENENDTSMSENATDECETSPLMLQFVNQCVGYFLKELLDVHMQNKLSDSVCLQLIYCSFRLRDLNPNYHHLFLNKICESNLFTAEQLKYAIDKRRELASKYS